MNDITDITKAMHLENSQLENPSRRDFIVKSAVAGGGLALGLAGCATGTEGNAPYTGPVTEINSWVLVQIGRAHV